MGLQTRARERASPISARDHGIRSTEEPPVHSRDIAQQQAQAEEGRRLGSVRTAGATPVGPHSLRLLAKQFLVRVRIECHHAPPPRLSSSAAAAIRSLRLRRRRRLGLLRGASRVAALRLGRLVLDEVRVLPLSTSAGLASTSRPGGGLLVRRLRRDAITGKPRRTRKTEGCMGGWTGWIDMKRAADGSELILRSRGGEASIAGHAAALCCKRLRQARPHRFRALAAAGLVFAAAGFLLAAVGLFLAPAGLLKVELKLEDGLGFGCRRLLFIVLFLLLAVSLSPLRRTARQPRRSCRRAKTCI